jgi:hypothetical protein
MADETTQTTLRDTIEQSFDTVVKEPTAPIEAKTEPQTEVKVETEEQKAQRLRDEKGRFTPGKAEAKPEEIKAEAKARPQRPSSWKKEMWDRWEKLDPETAEYIHKREQEFSKGVSTYKQEWDNAKPILDAMAPFQQILQQNNIHPAQWISNLGNAHRMLALGSPEQKLQMFRRLAQDYQIPIQGLTQEKPPEFIQYLNPLQEKINQLEGQLHSYTSRAEQDQQSTINREIDRIAQEKDAQGNFVRPNFEEVRETMAGLLQSGLADDLQSAYEAAIRHPRHKEIFDHQQQQLAKIEADRKAEEERQRVTRAKAQTVSTKSTTPGAAVPPSSKGLRADIEDSFNAITGGRV